MIFSNQWYQFFLISVSDLPNKYYDHLPGASALSSLSGNGAYLQHQQHFYELVCSTKSCNWTIMEKKLKTPVIYATSMYLPHDYTCWSWDSKCTCTLRCDNLIQLHIFFSYHFEAYHVMILILIEQMCYQEMEPISNMRSNSKLVFCTTYCILMVTK